MAKQNSQTLRKQAEELLAKAEAIEAEDRAHLFDEIMKSLDESGATLDDLLEHIRPEKAKKSHSTKGGILPKKFKGLEEGQLWSGRGNQPSWFKDLIAQGMTESDLLVVKPQ